MMQITILKSVDIVQLHQEIIDASINVETINYDGTNVNLKLMEDAKEAQLRTLVTDHTITPSRDFKAEYAALSTDAARIALIAEIGGLT